jgi:hypothetical protein
MKKQFDFWDSKEGKRLIKEDGVRKIRDFRLRLKQQYNITKRNDPNAYEALMNHFIGGGFKE